MGNCPEILFCRTDNTMLGRAIASLFLVSVVMMPHLCAAAAPAIIERECLKIIKARIGVKTFPILPCALNPPTEPLPPPSRIRKARIKAAPEGTVIECVEIVKTTNGPRRAPITPCPP